MAATTSKYLSTVLVALLLGGISGCTYNPAYHRGPPRYVYPPYYYDYYYYPHADVYFHIYTGRYYYRRPSGWSHVRKLPGKIYLDHRYRVPVRVHETKPYVRHREHRERYRYTVQYPYHRSTAPARAQARDRNERRHNRQRHEEYQRRHEQRRQ